MCVLFPVHLSLNLALEDGMHVIKTAPELYF